MEPALFRDFGICRPLFRFLESPVSSLDENDLLYQHVICRVALPNGER